MVREIDRSLALAGAVGDWARRIGLAAPDPTVQRAYFAVETTARSVAATIRARIARQDGSPVNAIEVAQVVGAELRRLHATAVRAGVPEAARIAHAVGTGAWAA